MDEENLEENLAEIFGDAEDVGGQFKWNAEAIKLLLSERLSREEKFANPTCAKKKLWKYIATKMKEYNYSVSGDACNLKYRNLLQTYRKNKVKLHKSGESSTTWSYYETFDRVLGNKPSINPNPETIGDTISAENDTTDENASNFNEEHNTLQQEAQCKCKSSKTWKAEYFKNKMRSKTEEMEKKSKQWEEKKDIENRRINAIIDLTNVLGEYTKLKQRELDRSTVCGSYESDTD